LCLFFFCMLRFWTRPLRPALTSFSRAMSQSTVEFVSFHTAILSARACAPREITYFHLLSTSVLINITDFRTKSSMPLSPRWILKFRTSSTRRHGGNTLVSSSLHQRCEASS
jgi:hypothetical protein